MRLKKETHTEEYYVYDCPLCGKEVRLFTLHSEQEPCDGCTTAIHTLRQYKENKFLLGAVISDIEVDEDGLDSFTITTRNSRKYRVSSCPDYDGGAELEIEEIEEKSNE